jgi:endonuclease-3
MRGLENRHGAKPRPETVDALGMLVRAILSQNTNRANSSRGYAMLRREFPTWTKVMNAPVEKVQRQIAICGLANTRAGRIQELLRRIKAERGRLSLDFLAHEPAPAAKAYLLSFRGIGPKTANVTLCFAFGQPVLPVDRGVLRVLRRLRIVGPRTGDIAASDRLSPLIPAGKHYPLHVLMYDHAKELCKAKNPKCADCPLLGTCTYGQRRVKHHPNGEDGRNIKVPKWFLSRVISSGIHRNDDARRAR